MEKETKKRKQKKHKAGKIIGWIFLALLLLIVFRYGRTIYWTIRYFLPGGQSGTMEEPPAPDVILSEEELALESEGKYGPDWAENARAAGVGDTILLGQYEQDGVEENGREDIEWIVLEKDGDSLLLMSRYILDVDQYCGLYSHVQPDLLSWENSDLRLWMHKVLLNNAFSADAMKYLQSVHFTSGEFPDGSVKDTWDLIFCPEQETIERYFKTKDDRRATPTEYAVSRGLYAADVGDMLTAEYFLYTWLEAGEYTSIYSIDFYGTIYESSTVADVGIRPCIRLDLNPDSIAREEARIETLGRETYRMLKSACERSTITLGRYEQDADPATENEPIEWLVLENDGSSLKLVSNTILDVIDVYDPNFIEPGFDSTDKAWTETPLCLWLNNDFAAAAFSAEEQALLCPAGEEGLLPVDLMTQEEAKTFFLTSKYTGDRDRCCFVSPYSMTKYDSYTEASKYHNQEGLELYWGSWSVLNASGDLNNVNKYGGLDENNFVYTAGIRPVINLEW